MKAIFALLLVLMVPVSEGAYFKDGNDLARWIAADDRVDAGTSEETDYYEAARLHGYITGIYDTFSDTAICPPGAVSINQLLAITKKHVRSNPEHWGAPGSSIVYVALSKAFPCPKK